MADDDLDNGTDDEDFDRPDPKSKLNDGGGKGKDEFADDADDNDDDLADLDVEIEDTKSKRDDKRSDSRDDDGRFKARSEEERFGKRRKPKYRESRQIRDLQEQLNQERLRNDKLAERVDTVAKDTTRIDVSNIDSQLGEAQRYLEHAKSAHAQAVKDGDGDKAAEALDVMMEAKEALTILKEAKKQRKEHVERDGGDTTRTDSRREAEQPRKADPVVMRQFNKWHEDNDWFDPGLRDQESRIALHIDTTMKAEGWDPRSPDYWQELNDRLRQNPTLSRKIFTGEDNDEEDEDEMPTRTRRESNDNRRDGGEDRKRNQRPINERTNQSSGNRKKLVVSRERADAMREMGLQPGTLEWKKMAKKFESYDKQRSASQGR